MKVFKYLTMAAAALMMAACSSDEIASVAQKGRTPLEIVPVVKTQTRAAQITTDNLTTFTVDVTGTFVTAGGENVVNPVLTLTKSGSTWSYTYNGDNAGPLYWPSAAQTAYFSAHTLAGGATVNEATTQQDAIGAYATKEFDGSTNPGTVSLTFKHAVAKMEFKARVNAATSGTVQATIDIKQVAVRNMKYTGTYAIPTATANQDMGVITPTAAVTSLLTDERSETTFLTKDDAAATSLGSLFMVPQAVTAEDLSQSTWDDAYIAVLAQIRIKNGDADATMLFPSAGAVDNSSYAWVAVPMPADFTQMQAHKKYIFTINFSADALGKVDRNQDGGGEDIEIEGRSSSPVTVSVEHVYDFDAEGDDIDVNLPTASASVPTGIINGLFSVSATKQVYFSQGNLQYQASTGTWRFAEHQYDFIGGGNFLSESNTEWIDLYRWGTSGIDYTGHATLYRPWEWAYDSQDFNPYGSLTTNLYDGAGENAGKADWGYNAISNGGNTQNSGWRTLKNNTTDNEWQYIFNTRTTANEINSTSNARYTQARINIDDWAVRGIILFPDGSIGDTPSGVTWGTINAAASSWTTGTTQCTTAGWAALEAAGCVFLPASGKYDDSGVSQAEIEGYYWSSSYASDDNAYGMYFYSNEVNPQYSDARHYGLSVRLVYDAN